MAKKTYKIVSLFSGCGGLDLGFTGGFNFNGQTYKKLPTKVVFANDFDVDASTCYNSNRLLTNNGEKCLLKDIREVSAEDIPDYDILLAGFPCQPFSNAGNRKGVHDVNGRGTLFEECERILKCKVDKGKRPLAFVFENVRGIMSSKMPTGITVPEEIRNRMNDLGYNVSMQLVCSSDFGVPQKRYRFLIIGIDRERGSFDFSTLEEIVEKYKIPSTKNGHDEKLLIGSVLYDIASASENETWDYTQGTQSMVEKIGPCVHGAEAINLFAPGFKKEELPQNVFLGRSWKDVPPEQLTPRFRRIYDNPKKYHAPKFFRRFAFGEINGTITASAQPENCGITHPIENRRYTVREIARIQSFPDDFSFSAIPLQSRYKVIGNAVPPVMAWVIASALIETIK